MTLKESIEEYEDKLNKPIFNREAQKIPFQEVSAGLGGISSKLDGSVTVQMTGPITQTEKATGLLGEN